MAMIPKTLGEVFTYTQKFHEKLAHHLNQSATHNHSEREQLLLSYLAEHERNLGKVLQVFSQNARAGQLNTWFYEYTDRHKIAALDPSDTDFSHKNCEQIGTDIILFHRQLIDLYEHLYQRAESDTAREVLSQLCAIETDRAKTISNDCNRSQEM